MVSIILPWVTAILVLLLMALWTMRLICTKSRFENNRTLKTIRRILRKIHAPLAIVALIVVYFHCSVAERVTGESSLMGAILLLCMLAMCLTGLLKRLIPRYWLMLHRVITVIMLIILIFHIFIEANL